MPGDVLLELLDLGLLLDRRCAGGRRLFLLRGLGGEGVQGLLDGQAGDRPLHGLVAGPDLLATVQAGDGLVVLLPLFERLAQPQFDVEVLGAGLQGRLMVDQLDLVAARTPSLRRPSAAGWGFPKG